MGPDGFIGEKEGGWYFFNHPSAKTVLSLRLGTASASQETLSLVPDQGQVLSAGIRIPR